MSLNQHNDGSEGLRNITENQGTDGADVLPVDSPSVLVTKTGKEKVKRHVTFPEDDSQLVTGYLEPVNPWQAVGEISGSELIEEYVASCEKHNTIPQQIVIDQLKEYRVLGASRSGVFCLSSHPLLPAQCEALESILKKARFNRLEVRNVGLTDETAVALFDMLEYYESASELDISCNTDFGISGWQACSRMIHKSQCLEQLEARGTSLSESTAPVLGRGLRSPCTLRVLHLQRAGLRGGPLLCLAGALKSNKSVRELHIGDNNLIPDDANHLASLLRNNTFLQLLDISNNDIQDLGVERIAEALSEQSSPSPSPSPPTSTSTSSSSHPSTPSSSSSSSQERGLAVLVVWNNNLTRNSGNHLSKALSRCKSLEVLNIGQNPLGGETINRVRVALQQNRSLLCLGVQSAKLGAEAGVALAEVIEDNHYIQRIDLRDNKLQAAGLLALATALRKNYALTRLDLDDAPTPHNNGIEQPLEEARLIEEIRSLCKRNEIHQNQQQSTPSTPTSEENLHRRRVASFSNRKISLTCQTLNRSYEPIPEPVLSPPKTTSGRLRSPLPSPIPSPASSPTPSPSHGRNNRFIVSRVSDSSSITSDSSSPSTPSSTRSFFPNSRFKVVSVQEPPKINVTMATEEQQNVNRVDANNQTDLNKNVCSNTVFDKETSTQDTETIGNMEDAGQGDVITNSEGNLIEKVAMEEDNINKDNSITEEQATITNTQPNVGHKEENVFTKMSPAIKKNKSESSLDSPDLEVSRLMRKKEAYDSSSSLDISGSSIESLNNIESNVNNNTRSTTHESEDVLSQDNNVVYTLQNENEDVFPTKGYKNPFIYSVVTEGSSNKKKLSASSNESSIETFEAGVTVAFPFTPSGHQSNLLNSSVSSNESVSPNIFGKHMKLHGSVTSLEASVSSLDSYRSKGDFVSPQNPVAFSFPTPENSLITESLDSGMPQSEVKTRTPSFNESFSSNEGTLTSSSNMKSSIFSIGGDSSISIEEDNEKDSTSEQQLQVEEPPRRVTSLLDVPSMQKSQRMRKISWVAPSHFNQTTQQAPPPQPDDQQQIPTSSKVPSSLEKLLSLFQHPTSLFSKSDSTEKKSNDSSQSPSRRDSQTAMGSSGSFWPWNLSTSGSAVSGVKGDNKSSTIGAIERLKKYGESFETALQFNNDNSEKKVDLHASKSDTYLENKDAGTTLAEKIKETLFVRPVEPKPVVNIDESPQLSSSPPIYSIDSEYLKQTLIPCIIHPFQNPNVSTDYTFKISSDVKGDCTCSVKGMPLLGTCDISTTEPGILDTNNADVDSVIKEQLIQNVDSNESDAIVDSEDIESRNCDTITNDNSNKLISLVKDRIDREPYEMGSVFKFHDVYEEHKDLTNKESSPSPTSNNSTKEQGRGEKLMRVLSESECQNISDIVRSVCEEAVKTVANRNKVVENSDICDRNISSEIQENSQVQNVKRFDCDNNCKLSSNQGCICDSNNLCNILSVQHCKYLDSINIIHNSNNDVDLKTQTLSNENNSYTCDIQTENTTTEPTTNNITSITRSNSTQPDVSTSLDNTTHEALTDTKHAPRTVVQEISQPPEPVNLLLNIHNTNVIETVPINLEPIVDVFNTDNLENISENKNIQISSENFKKELSLDLKKDAIYPTEILLRTTPPKQMAMVLKQSIGLENKTSPGDRQSPESGPSVDNLPSKIIKRIKENVSPENTLTPSMSNTKALAQELLESKKAAFWDIGLKENVEKILEVSNINISDDSNRFYDEFLVQSFGKYDDSVKSPLKTVIDENNSIQQDFDSGSSTKYGEGNSLSDVDQGSDVLTVKELISDETVTSTDDTIGMDSIIHCALEEDESLYDTPILTDAINTTNVLTEKQHNSTSVQHSATSNVDVEKDDDFTNNDKIESIAIDVASEIIVDQTTTQTEESEKGDKFNDVPTISAFKPVSILKKATPSISKTVSLPQDIPEATRPFPYYGFTLPTPKKCYEGDSSKLSSLPVRCGSLPENTTSTLSGDEVLDSSLHLRRGIAVRSPVQSKLGKIARDSLYALNMSEDELKEYRSSGRLSSMDSVRSLGSLSEDLEGLSSSSYVFQSSSDGESIVEQGASQGSLISLESISENNSENGNVEKEPRTFDSV